MVALRGRKPKPPELRLVEGNPGKRALKPREEIPKAEGEPRRPKDFDAEHKREWQAIVEDMRSAGTLSADCGEAIEVLVRNLIRMRKAEAHVALHGAIVPAPRTGVPMHNPYLAVANKAAEMVARMTAELGRTPSARGRVTKADGPSQENPADRFFA